MNKMYPKVTKFKILFRAVAGWKHTAECHGKKEGENGKYSINDEKNGGCQEKITKAKRKKRQKSLFLYKLLF